jgi:hypothetical protein
MATAHHVGFRGVRRAGLVLVAAAVAAPAVALRAPAPLRVALASGATLWRADAAVLDLDGRADPARLLEALRRAGIARLDIVVVRTSTKSTSDTIDVLRRRFEIGDLLTPLTSVEATSLVVGGLRVELRPAGGRLTVEISLEPTGSARGPPV